MRRLFERELVRDEGQDGFGTALHQLRRSREVAALAGAHPEHVELAERECPDAQRHVV